VSVVEVRAAGSPAEMGRTHGEMLAAQIRDAVSFYEDVMAGSGGTADPVSALPPYIDAARTTWPDLAGEIDGLAGSAGIDLEAAWLLNCLEEVWPFEACTTVSSGTFLLHSEQWYAGHEGVAAIVAEPEDGPSFVSPTSVGFLPAVGMSAAGFAQGIASLTARDDGAGIPRVLVSRRALGAVSLEEAIVAACTSGRAGGYAHSLKSANAAVVVETTAHQADELWGTAAHTNHYLSEKLLPVGDDASRGSLRRLSGARERLEHEPPRTLDDCVEMMSDHGEPRSPFCLHGTGVETGTSFAMICDVSTGTMLVSEGPPCEGRWHELSVPDFKTEGASHVG
jgi:Acyl-coenzyme A:6-aminopenicillanic acid acyl-transferase